MTSSVMAIEFSPIRLHSRLGETLLAEIDVRAGPGDTLTANCFRLSRPASSSLARLDDLSLGFEGSASGGTLRVSSSSPVVEPAAVFAIEASCGSGRVWQELAVVLGAAAGGKSIDRPGEWVAQAGESPRSLAAVLFPGQEGSQRRFIEALAAANPDAGIPADPARALVAGSTLRMPDWRALNGGRADVPGKPNRRAGTIPAGDVLRIEASSGDALRIGAPPVAARQSGARAGQGGVATAAPLTTPLLPAVSRPEGPVFLQLSTALSTSPGVTETLRETLRLEYRLLTRLSEQLVTSLDGRQETMGVLAPAPSMPGAPLRDSARDPMPEPTPVAAAAPAPLVPPVRPATEPRQIPQVPAPQMETEEPVDWIVIGGIVGALGLVLLLLWRRASRPVAMPTVRAPATMDAAETVMADDHPPAMSSEAVDAFFAEPPKPAAIAVSTPPPAVAEAPAVADMNPVIELAEIMLSFGRIHGAAQTLQEFIETHPKEALLPWMKLLEIYRGGDMRDEFDELSIKLHDNFNVELQHWDLSAPPPPRDPDIPPKALTLEDVPHICERIVSTWDRPECLEYLHQLLRDNRGGSRTGFTLSLVQEILLLIDIQAERSAAAGNS